MKRLALFVSIFFVAGCVTPGQGSRLLPVRTAISDVQIEARRQEVFDAALIVSQYLSLNVAVLEKDSGLIRFETAALTASQLDQYCEYPFVNRTGQPWDTFIAWYSRSSQAGTGQVRGKVSLTILISEIPKGANLNLRAHWSAYNGNEEFDCNSTGIFEEEFVSELKIKLGEIRKRPESET